MAPVQCARCGVVISSEVGGERLASISGSIFGDECTETWYYCAQCDVYTVEIYWDTFLGEDSASTRGPIPRADEDEQIALIRECTTPWLKTCRCPAHRAYFGNVLDQQMP